MTRTTGFPGIGVLFRATDQTRFLELTHAVADRGFSSVVLGEHTHIPVASDPAGFPGGGDEIPPTYLRLIDPYIGLAFAAAQTPLKIATSTSLPAQHDPIALAKALATLDHLSGGRLTVGVGYGWNAAELENHGHQWSARRAIVREYVQLMRALWTETQAEYHGAHVDLEPSWSWPKPAQTRIPVLLGAAGQDRAMAAIVDWADGWMPGGSIPWVAERLAVLRRLWVEAGRAESGPVIWFIQDAVDAEKLRRRLDRLAQLDVDEVVVAFDTVDADEILPALDDYEKVISANAG